MSSLAPRCTVTISTNALFKNKIDSVRGSMVRVPNERNVTAKLEVCDGGPVSSNETSVAIDTMDSDPHSLDELFRRYRSTLRRLVSRLLVNSVDSEDVVQDAFLRVWRKMRAGVVGASARGYLFQSAINAARDRNRRHRAIENRHDEYPLSDIELTDSNVPPAEDACHWAYELDALENSLSALPADTRSVFVLYHVEGMSVVDIANSAGKSTRTVERHLAAALAHCVSDRNNRSSTYNKVVESKYAVPNQLQAPELYKCKS